MANLLNIQERMVSMVFRKMRNSWVRRRWLDFRQGHSIYLVFLMTFANFITIQYSLLIERMPTFDSIFPSVWIFATIFVAGYIPLAIFIGYWHRKSQWKVEAEALFKENKIGATMWLFVIDMIDGKVTEEEKKEMRIMLSNIIKRRDAKTPKENAEASENQKQDKENAGEVKTGQV